MALNVSKNPFMALPLKVRVRGDKFSRGQELGAKGTVNLTKESDFNQECAVTKFVLKTHFGARLCPE